MTLALLLAIGEAIETPFRVMDEFDVFLVSIARKIALNTLVSTVEEQHNAFGECKLTLSARCAI